MGRLFHLPGRLTGSASMPSAHLAIVSPYSDLRIIPCVYGMVRHLEAQGIQTTLFVPGAPETAMGEVDGGLEIGRAHV